MTDLSGILQGAEGDGVQWAVETPGELNVNLVHLEAGHAVGEHVNDEVDVVIVVLAGQGWLTIDGERTDLAAHVVAYVPRHTRRGVHAGAGHGLDYLSIHRRRAPLGIKPGGRAGRAAETTEPHELGGDPACWAHLFDDDTDDTDDSADSADSDDTDGADGTGDGDSADTTG